MVIRGLWVTDDYAVPVTIQVHPYFRRYPPQVFCEAQWIRRHKDWHCSIFGGLCWILAAQWEDAHKALEKPWSTVIKDGLNLLHADLTVLLNRHWVGYKLGLKEWDPDWTEWRHDEKDGSGGTQDYREQIQKDGKPYNWENAA